MRDGIKGFVKIDIDNTTNGLKSKAYCIYSNKCCGIYFLRQLLGRHLLESGVYWRAVFNYS